MIYSTQIGRQGVVWAIIVWTLALVLTSVPSFSQDATEQDSATAEPPNANTSENAADERLQSPPDTILTFVNAMSEWTGSGSKPPLPEGAMIACDFGDITDSRQRASAVGKLYNVLNIIGEVTRGEFVDDVFAEYESNTWTYFPRENQPRDRDTLAKKYRGTVEIVLTKDAAGEWRFSEQTMANAAAMIRAIEGEEQRVGQGMVAITLADKIRAIMPAALKSGTFLTLEYWVWIIVFLVILLGVVIDHLVRSILSSVWHKVEKRRGTQSDRKVLKRAVRPFGLFAAALVWYSAIVLGDLSPLAQQVLLTAVRVVLSFAGVWAAWRVTDLLADFALRQTAKTETKIDDLLVPLVERSVKILIFAMGLLYIASAFNIPILPLLSGLGIGGLAVAFAAKDTIENFFGSVAVILDRPFEVGDWINVDGTEGTVEDLGFRSTRVRTFYNSLVTVPNASLVRATVDNYGRRRYRRFRTMVNVTYDTHPDKIEAFCEGIREIIRQHPYTRKDSYHVWLNQFGAHSLDILVYMFHECPDWSIELRERHRFMLDVIRLADKLGVEFAFPTQTLHVFQEEHGSEHKPMPSPPKTAETDAQKAGIEAVRELTKDQPWQEQRPGPVKFTH